MNISNNPGVNIENTSNKWIFRNYVWIINAIVLGLLAITSLYIIVSLFFYRSKRNSKRKSTNLSPEIKFRRKAKQLSILISVATFLYQIFSLTRLSIQMAFQKYNPSSLNFESFQVICKILPRVEIFLVIIGTGLVYLFLWFRQRVFYINPSLKSLNGTLVKVISYIVLGLWIVYFVPAAVVYCVLVDYKVIFPEGCAVVKSTITIYGDIIRSWACVAIFMQLALLGLFVNPIIRRTRLINQKQSNPKRISSSARLLKRVKKAIILTVMCLISDILALVLTIFTTLRNTNNFVFFYNINLLVNLSAVIGCFDNWPFIIRPWSRKKAITGPKNRSSRFIVTSTERGPPPLPKSEDSSVGRGGFSVMRIR